MAIQLLNSDEIRLLGMDAEAPIPAKKIVALPEEKILLELPAAKREALRLMAQGYNNVEIARKLMLSEKTVATMSRSFMPNCKSTAGAKRL